MAAAIINSIVLGSVPTVLFLGYKISRLRENLMKNFTSGVNMEIP